MSRVRTQEFVVLLIAAASFVSSVSAQLSEQGDRIHAWLLAELQSAGAEFDIGSAYIAWDVEDRSLPESGEWSRLLAEVPGHPDHPERQRFEAYKRHLNGEPDVDTFRLWTQGPGQWRYAQDLIRLGGFWDACITKEHAWEYANSILGAFASKDGNAVGKNLAIHISGAAWNIRPLLHGGLAYAAAFRCKPGPVVMLSKNDWQCTLRRDPDQVNASYELRADGAVGADGQPFVSAVHVLKDAATPGNLGTRWVSLDWTHSLGRLRIAGRFDELNASGECVKSIRLRELRGLETQEFDNVSAMPVPGGHDAIRGFVGVNQLNDYRTGVVSFPNKPGAQPVPIPSTVSATTTPSSGAGSLRLVGWVAGICTLVFVVVVRLRSKA